MSVIGALTGLDRVEKIVRINGRGVDMRAEGHNLFFRYTDVPGALGKAASQLGEANINIEAAALTQTSRGNGAILILRVERAVEEEIVDSICAALEASAIQLNLG